MKNTIKLLPLSLALASTTAWSANYAIEARGDAMGGVGVVSANFLTAPFYNPALTAIYRRNDDIGMITPSFGLLYDDHNQLVDDLDSASEIIASADPTRASELQTVLDNMEGDQLKAEIGGVVAFAIPNRFIAANLYGKAYYESFVNPVISTASTNPDPNLATLENAQNSTVNAVSIGVTEVGLSLAKYQTFLGQHIAFGVTPKLQRIYTYVYEASLSDYSLADTRDNDTGETMLNFDAGFVWFYGPIRAGISASNLISRDIETKTVVSAIPTNPALSYSYQMRPLYTVGFGLVADYATISVDYDLNEEERYTNFDDNTQMLRVGGEIDILRQLKLRAGWKRNLAYDNLDDTITAGIGISPLNLFQMDIGASYTNENSMGAYINFLTSY
ncbi:conjugal transfer protein TraF [Vibrio variabilis]|uniref:Conjugal transfer protein TraF n=1 Tax=Vibrio variabilis TaxID=990271 RepID=A0ABR4Y882_9VIBR|nr:conjugal transfer protein TraF [Vibrio variabilis]KHA59678.1 conjugal transfer protein TraF [Vibrio variabilis]